MSQNNSSLTQAINDMRTMRESYDALINTSEVFSSELSAGKTALATAINAKNPVEPVTAETPLSGMATAVSTIAQEHIDIDDTAWYGKQIGAGGAMWDLYAVLKEMKNTFLNNSYQHGDNTYNYNALIVAEYYKGYDSIDLNFADAYYTSDGVFYDYHSVHHVWNDINDGKSNRWVCFLYVEGGSSANITFSSAHSGKDPRKMFIGGHIGTISYDINGRLTELVCGIEDTDTIDNLLMDNKTQEWQFNMVIRNVRTTSYIQNLLSQGAVCIEYIKNDDIRTNLLRVSYASSLEVKGVKYVNMSGLSGGIKYQVGNAILVSFPDLEEILSDPSGAFTCGNYQSVDVKTQVVSLPNLKKVGGLSWKIMNASNDVIDLIVGEMETSFKSGWNPTNVLADTSKKAQLIDNIKNHILARVSDATGGTQLVFTVSTNMYNAIASETITWNDQTMTLADAFLTKNWLLAGA